MICLDRVPIRLIEVHTGHSMRASSVVPRRFVRSWQCPKHSVLEVENVKKIRGRQVYSVHSLELTAASAI